MKFFILMVDSLMGLIVIIQFEKFEFAPDDPVVMKKEQCSETTIDGMKCTNCSSDVPNTTLAVTDFPPDLGSDLKCLYSMNLRLENINSKTFQKYPELTHLHIIRGSFIATFPKNTFEPLKKLQLLNLSYTNMWTNTEITWPPSLKILDITEFPVDTYVGLTLHSLQVLNVSGTKITEFPTLSETAPLKLIVLDRMNLTNFKIEDLARLCKLESISTLNTSLGNDNCKCLLLKTWSKKYNVTILNEMSCQTDTKCSLTFTDTSLKNRNDCLDKNAVKRWYIAVIIAVLLGPLLLILCLCGFLYTWLVRKEEEEGILGITDEQLKNFTPRTQNATA